MDNILEELFSGEELEKKFENAEIKVIPEKEEKNLEELNDKNEED